LLASRSRARKQLFLSPSDLQVEVDVGQALGGSASRFARSIAGAFIEPSSCRRVSVLPQPRRPGRSPSRQSSSGQLVRATEFEPVCPLVLVCVCAPLDPPPKTITTVVVCCLLVCVCRRCRAHRRLRSLSKTTGIEISPSHGRTVGYRIRVQRSTSFQLCPLRYYCR